MTNPTFTLNDHAAIIRTWIESCTKPDHFRLCEEVIDRFIVERFGNCVTARYLKELVTTTEEKVCGVGVGSA